MKKIALAVVSVLIIKNALFAQNVGIGSSQFTPSSTLEIRSTNNTAGTYGFKLLNSSSAAMMFIQNDGNIGIGTSTSGEKLHVYGGNIAIEYGNSIRVSPASAWPSGTHELIKIDWNGAADRVGIYTPGSITPTAGITLLSNNLQGPLVGVGTITPVSKLDVNGGMSVGSYAGTNVAPANSLIVSGNVGIASNTPTQALEIGGTNARIFMNSGTSNLIDFGQTGVAAPGANSAGQKIRLFGSGAVAAGQYALGVEASYMWFSNDQTAAGSGFKWYGGGTNEVVRFQGNGNVGIGVGGAAVNKLDVEGGMAIGATYSGTNTASTNGLLVEGNVGIGTTSTGQKLHVTAGNISIDNTYSVLFAGSADSNWKIYRNATADFTKSLVSGASININAFNAAGEGFAIGRNGGNSYYEILGSGPTHYFRGNVGIDVTTPQNKLDVEGAAVIGATYSGTNAGPTNGLLVQGNIGIGTTTTVNKLDVEGGVAIGATYSGTNTAPTNGLLVEGFVGIGTATAVSPLDVWRNDNNGIVLRGSSTDMISMSFNNSTASGNDWILASGGGGRGVGVGKFFLYKNTAPTLVPFVVDANGNIGVGTATPQNKLDVEGGAVIGATYSGTNAGPTNGLLVEGNVSMGTTASTRKLAIEVVNGVSEDGIDIQRGIGGGGVGSIWGFRLKASGGNYRGAISVKGNPTASYPEKEAMTFAIDDGYWGYVGVGATAPRTKFDIRGTSASADATIQIVGTGVSALMLGQNANGGVIRAQGGNNALMFYNGGTGDMAADGSGTERMRIDQNGNVGINCNNPQYTLHVVGDIASSATVRTTNALATGAITACSDIRYKKEITPLANSLDNILRLQGVNYKWKTDEFKEKKFSNQKQIGFIAQEMEKIYPEVVLTDVDGYKAIDYSKLTPILVEAIKEQQQKINSQQLTIDNQQKTISGLQVTTESQQKMIEGLKTENTLQENRLQKIEQQLFEIKGNNIQTKK